MKKYSKNFIKDTIEVWQPYSNITLSPTDAIEIAENMISLFNFLITEDKKSETKGINKKYILTKNIKKQGR